MDGNGRWAKRAGKTRTYGHRAGHTAVLKIVRHAAQIGIESLTLYAFSSENWARPETEVKALMRLFSQAVKRNRRLFLKNHIRFRVIGDRGAFSQKLQTDIERLEHDTAHHRTMTVNIAANYGGKWDIVQAAKQIVGKVQANKLTIDEITENSFSQHLALADQQPVDLLIRTGGEQRISNYLLWQSAYAELYFTPIFWPDFDERAFDDAIGEYLHRTRRFGGL